MGAAAPHRTPSWKRALALGFLSWLLPFAFSFLVFPIKQVNSSLFETIMSVTVVLTAAFLGRQCFRNDVPRAAEALLVGFLWLAINLICDYPMFSFGPMRMTSSRYFSEIGAGYLLYPAVLAGAAWAAGRRPRTI